jgi:hypothetical protein
MHTKKIVVDGKEGIFMCDLDTSLYVAKEMVFQFLKYLGQIEDAARAQQSTKSEQVQQSSSDHCVSEE